MTLDEAMNLLAIDAPFNLVQLKDAYRRLIKRWHPDINSSAKATEMCQLINVAYDRLESLASKNFGTEDWSSYTRRMLPEWEAKFKERWRMSYRMAIDSELYGGLHYSTFLIGFRRSYIEPRPEWFRGVLFPNDRPSDRVKYREQLLAIAPNRLMREEWARKYFSLEFGDSSWIFYLPPSRRELAGAVS